MLLKQPRHPFYAELVEVSKGWRGEYWKTSFKNIRKSHIINLTQLIEKFNIHKNLKSVRYPKRHFRIKETICDVANPACEA